MSSYTVFAGQRKLAHGDLASLAQYVKRACDEQALFQGQFHVFADQTGAVLDLDLRGDLAAVAARYSAAAATVSEPDSEQEKEPDEVPRGRGRPKLGVVSKEVTLLPRHWQWLAAQPGGASVALRKLIDEARKAQGDTEQVRQLQERTYKVMAALAADLPGYESAIRALFATDKAGFDRAMQAWPADYRDYFLSLAGLTATPAAIQTEVEKHHD